MASQAVARAGPRGVQSPVKVSGGVQSPVQVAEVKPWEISQSTLLLSAVVIGFVFYLLIKGKLLTYWQLLSGQAATTGSAASVAPQPPATQPPTTVLTQPASVMGSFAGVTSDVLDAVQLFGLGG